MSLLFETIRIEHGIIHNLSYHEARFNATRHALFDAKPLSLTPFLQTDFQACTRAKLIYNETIQRVEYHPYTPRMIKRFVLKSHDVEYRYKYLDRSIFDAMRTGLDEAEEPIIVQNGLVTDTTFSNLAFWLDGVWVTPKTPLLHGAIRAYLLDKSMLIEGDITPKLAQSAPKIAMINAMIGFNVIDNCVIGV